MHTRHRETFPREDVQHLYQPVGGGPTGRYTLCSYMQMCSGKTEKKVVEQHSFSWVIKLNVLARGGSKNGWNKIASLNAHTYGGIATHTESFGKHRLSEKA